MYIINESCCSVSAPEFSNGNCLLAKIGNDTVVIGIYIAHKSLSFNSVDGILVSLNDIIITVAYVKNIILVGNINIAINLKKRDSASEKYLNIAS